MAPIMGIMPVATRKPNTAPDTTTTTTTTTNGELFDDKPAEPPPGAGDAWEPPTDAATDLDPKALSTSRDGEPAAAPDPFDPASLRLTSDFNATVGVKKAILTVTVRKPDKAWWVHAHPDPAYRLQTAVIELRGERGGGETFLVAPHLRADLATEPTFRPKLFVTAVSTQGTLFLWDCSLPRDDRQDNWAQTALAAVDLATKGWVRVAANMSAGGYDCWQATGNLPAPQWPDLAFKEVLRLAFKDRFITSLDHPVLRRLRGEA